MDDNTRIFDGAYDNEEVGGQADLNNLETTINVSSIPTTRINKDHLIELIIGDLQSAPLTRRMSQQNLEEHCLVRYINKQRRTNHKDYQNCLFAYFLSKKEPKKVIQALEDQNWIEAMQEELLQFKLQKVWTLVDLPNGKRAIGTKWMDVKSAFLYGTIEEEVYVCQPFGFEDPQFPDKVYKVEKALYGLHQTPKAWYETLSTYLLENRFRRGTIDKTLFIKKDRGDILLVQVYVDDIIFGSTKMSLCVEFEQMIYKRFQMSSIGELTFFLGLHVQQKEDGIFISKDKYVADILKKFDFVTVKAASTPIETNKSLNKDEEAKDVDVHLYRSMIGSLMYLTASRPDIMFVVCACARFQVTPKVSRLHAMKRIFRYLKASLDRKSTTGGCQFLGKMLISWQCKKQTIVANSTTKAEYVAAANCCGQVLWIQNQMLDYGFNFMNTKIYIDNESTICIVKNPVFHSKTKHIEIRHHFIRDSYEKKLIQVIKIHTDHNVADLLTKAFDVSSDEFGVKTGSCKVNAARQDLVLLGENNTAEGVNSKYNGFFASRSDKNVEFHQIVDFLTTSLIHYALTVSPTINASYIEKFWATSKSKTVNDVKQTHATVDGKKVDLGFSRGTQLQETTLRGADLRQGCKTWTTPLPPPKVIDIRNVEEEPKNDIQIPTYKPRQRKDEDGADCSNEGGALMERSDDETKHQTEEINEEGKGGNAVNTFVSLTSSKSSKKRPRAEHDEESVKKQKLEDDAER
ncbi:putative ribonuclease H-like domain-containing protein [Tanacetum coccineum]